MEMRAPMELRGSGPISGPIGGGGFLLVLTGPTGMMGFLMVYEILLFGEELKEIFSFMARSIRGEDGACSASSPTDSGPLLQVVFRLFVFTFFYFSIISAVFQPRKTKKRQNNQGKNELSIPLGEYRPIVFPVNPVNPGAVPLCLFRKLKSRKNVRTN